MPGLTVLGIGVAAVFVPVQNVALSGVEPEDAGVAGAASSATGQVGSAFGLAVVTNFFVLASAGGDTAEALVLGYSAVFVTAAVVFLLTALVAFALIRIPRPRLEVTVDRAVQDLVAPTRSR